MANIVRFDCFEVHLDSGQLYKRGLRIKLRDQPFSVLASLLEHPGRVVTREELRRRLWRDEVFVDFDNNLNIAIARLREALGDSAERPRFIETLPKHGYRFMAAVDEGSAETGGTRRARLVVLPFVNLSGDAAQEYFSDAMTDEVITAVAGVAPEQLAVIARTTAMHYRGSGKDIAQIGREIGVDYVVEGGVRRTDDRVSVNVQLIQVSDQTHLLARKYDADMRDIFSVHARIAEAIADHIPALAAIRERARPGDRTRRKPTEDLVAYNLYLQGRFRMGNGGEQLAEAKACFEQAVARDPRFALAYDALGEFYWWVGFGGRAAPREAFSMGLWAALRAIEIDNTLAETHALLGQFRKELDYNWSEVHREMARALELNPGSALVRFRNALSGLMPLGRLEEAAAELETALELDPMDLNARSWLAAMHWLGRQYDRAIRELQLVLEVDANSYMGNGVLGQTRCMERKFDEAITVLSKAVELSGGAPMMLSWLGLALAQSGNVTEAHALLQRLDAIASQAYVPATCFAWIHLGLGDIDAAFNWMDRAIEQRDPMMVPIRSYPFFDPIRSDPRFAVLLRKMNLADS